MIAFSSNYALPVWVISEISETQKTDLKISNEIYEIVNSRKALHILSLAKSTIRNNLEKELCKIKVPCCLVWGRQDIVTPLEVAEDFKRLIPHASLHWIDKCGHVPMLETPDKFNEVIDSFMGNIQAKNS